MPRQLISNRMLSHAFVRPILESLGQSVVHTTGSLNPGQIGVDTISADGFSLRVYARGSTTKCSVSVMNITAGRDRLYFSSAEKLAQYLPDKVGELDRLVRLVHRCGGDMEDRPFNGKTSIAMDAAQASVDDFANIVRDLSTSAVAPSR